jgi:predicted transcriptional regulator
MSTRTGPEILNILFGSEARVDLVSLFRKNPGLIDSIDGVARRMGRKSSVIRSDIAELIKLGILRTVNVSGKEAISLDRIKDSEIQRIVNDFTKESSQGIEVKV